ncbi:hypothetical protein B0H16DRAFT_1453135 [Mycena metata]|uniref:Uncharacterized protein n=1 Tax=Mycena metata TaxID=1033252 RepID=A0AAD7NMW4_9AGAR|nr:hypothetical protein B0H16DRAFT_1453135 [Mycena metata]
MWRNVSSEREEQEVPRLSGTVGSRGEWIRGTGNERQEAKAYLRQREAKRWRSEPSRVGPRSEDDVISMRKLGLARGASGLPDLVRGTEFQCELGWPVGEQEDEVRPGLAEARRSNERQAGHSRLGSWDWIQDRNDMVVARAANRWSRRGGRPDMAEPRRRALSDTLSGEDSDSEIGRMSGTMIVGSW